METIYLDRNESQYGPAPACYEALSRIGREQLTSYTRDYDRGIKSRVTERLSERLGVPERNILLGYGAELLLKMAVHRFARAGGSVMVPDASWWYYGAIASEVGAATCTYPIVDHGDEFRYDAEGMIRAYRAARPSVVLIASPNNPTGNVIPPEMLRQVLQEMRDATVIIDEAYWGFGSNDDAHVAPLLDEFDNVMIIRSFSKYFALAGVRMGYAVTSDRFSDFATYTTLFLGYQQIAENLVLAALDSPDYYIGIAARFDADKQIFYATLSGYSCLTCYRSDANFLLVKMLPEVATALKQRLAAAGIRAKFFTEPRFVDHMRLSLGTHEQNAVVLATIIETVEDLIGARNDYTLAV